MRPQQLLPVRRTMHHARAEGTTTPEGEPPEPTMDYQTPEQERGRDITRDVTKTSARSLSRESILTNGSKMTGLSAKSQRIVDSVLLRREKAMEERQRRERQNVDAELATLRNRVTSLQKEKAAMENRLQDLQDTVEELVTSEELPQDNGNPHAEKTHAGSPGVEPHDEPGGDANRKPSDLVIRTLLASVPQFAGPGGMVTVNDFIEKMETAIDAGQFTQTEALALATNKLTGQASLLWRSHSKDNPRGSHGRWSTWEELRDALHQQYHPREHQQTTMKDLANLTQAKCEGDLEKYIETFNTHYLQIPVPRDERFWAMRFHSGLTGERKIRVMLMTPELDNLNKVQEAARRDFRIIGDEKRRPVHGAGAAGLSSMKTAGTAGSSTTKPKPHSDKGKVTCYNCGKRGHIARDCRAPKKRKDPKNHGTKNERAPYAADSTSTNPSVANVAFHAHITEEPRRPRAVIDSGCTRHMINQREWFTSTQGTSQAVWTAGKNDENHDVSMEGDVTMVHNGTGTGFTLKQALHTPNFRMSLVSVPAATYNGLDVLFKADGQAMIMKGAKIRYDALVTTGTRDDRTRLFYLDATPVLNAQAKRDAGTGFALASTTPMPDYHLWHTRLGHLGQQNLRLLQKQVHGDLTKIRAWEPTETCDVCQLSKQTRKSHPESNTKYQLGEIIHVDLVGPFPKSTAGNRYALTFVEGRSRHAWTYCIPNKQDSTTHSALINYLPYIERQLNASVKIHRSDRGGEFTGDAYARELDHRGIRQELTIRETPQQNGIAERINRTLAEKARALLLTSNLPIKLWDEIWRTAVYLYNRSPHRSIGGQVPHLVFTGKENLNLDHLRVIGSFAYAHIPRAKRDNEARKLAPTAEKKVLVGYSVSSKGYRLWDPSDDSIIERFDVTIDESRIYAPPEGSDDPVDQRTSLFTDNEARTRSVTEILAYMYVKGGDLRFKVKWMDEAVSWEQAQALPAEMVKEYCRRLNLMTPPEIEETMIKPALEQALAMAAMLANYTIEPRTYKEAMESPEAEEWRQAMQKEITTLESFPAWNLVPRPKNRHVLRGKWVFKRKLYPDGSINKHRARFVAQGCTQKKGIDYQETFSPVISAAAIRTVIAVATHNQWIIRQRDVVLAYLNGELTDVEIFIEQPEGFSTGPESVCRLNRALYGLKQSGRVWNHRLHEELIMLGLTQSPSEPCIYVLQEGQVARLVVAVYVDDILLTGPDEEVVSRFELSLAEKFKMTEGEDLTFILGIRVTTGDRMRFLDQKHFVLQVLERFGMQDANPAATPMEKGIMEKLQRSTEVDACDQARYAEAIGSLLWVSTMTRPDIAFATSFLARFIARPARDHWGAVKRVLRYLRGTIDHGITLEGRPDHSNQITTFCDSDWAGCRETRASTTGFIIKYGGSPISWRSQRQKCVATSSCEAEFIAGSAATQETKWLRTIAEQIDASITRGPSQLWIDNAGAAELAVNARVSSRSKHIDIRYHHLRQCAAEGVIQIERIPSAENPADIFTKPLDKEKFVKFRRMIGVDSLEEATRGEESQKKKNDERETA